MGREAKGLSKGRYDETFAGEDDANPTGSDPGLHYVEYVSRACPSV